MELPLDNKLNTRILGQIYDKTSATYKYYWFVSILNLVVIEKRRQFSFWEIITRWIAEAWYPVHYFRLSFGKSDSLYNQIIELQKELNIPIDARKEVIVNTILKHIESPKIRSMLRVFTLNVPYRFLSPWIRYTSDANVVLLSQSFTNECLYAIRGESIELNPHWEQYINDNFQILKDFTFWNLAIFLQKRNPNVPDISSKLVKPISRESLIKQKHFWDAYIDINGSIRCIYTGKELVKNHYALDHFIP